MSISYILLHWEDKHGNDYEGRRGRSEPQLDHLHLDQFGCSFVLTTK